MHIEKPDRYGVFRTVYAHSALLNLALGALARGREDDDQLSSFTAVVLAAFAFEAYLSFAVDALKLPARIRKGMWKAKFEGLCDFVDFAPDLASSPYKEVEELRELRNTLAHAKTEHLTAEVPAVEPVAYPLTRWEEAGQLATAERLTQAAWDAMKDLHERCGLDEGYPGFIGSRGGGFV